jgi:hypothetical protein
MTPGLRSNFSAAKRNVAKNIRNPGRNDARNAPTKISREQGAGSLHHCR